MNAKRKCYKGRKEKLRGAGTDTQQTAYLATPPCSLIIYYNKSCRKHFINPIINIFYNINEYKANKYSKEIYFTLIQTLN